MNFVTALVEHLRDNRESLVKTVGVRVMDYDPTSGDYSKTENIEIVDFDALLREIDAFSREFGGDDHG